MPEPTPTEIALRDPLSEVTRKERRLLLGVSMIGIALAKTGLLPEKISALGIEFSETNQKALLTVFSFITVYFLVAFTIYAAADFIAWRSVYYAVLKETWKRKEQEDLSKKSADPNDEFLSRHKFSIEDNIREQMRRERIVFYFGRPVMVVRAVFEFILPVAVGIFSIILLWKTPVH